MIDWQLHTSVDLCDVISVDLLDWNCHYIVQDVGIFLKEVLLSLHVLLMSLLKAITGLRVRALL